MASHGPAWTLPGSSLISARGQAHEALALPLQARITRVGSHARGSNTLDGIYPSQKTEKLEVFCPRPNVTVRPVAAGRGWGMIGQTRLCTDAAHLRACCGGAPAPSNARTAPAQEGSNLLGRQKHRNERRYGPWGVKVPLKASLAH